MLYEFWHNFSHNLFKPLLMFFYMGFAAPILGVKLDFPYIIYQGLTIYLLAAIGWHGGEELAAMPPETLLEAFGFMGVGFFTNLVIGILAYAILCRATNLRQIDKATVAGFYGSDSAGTFVTCLGALSTAGIAYAPYMPVLLAVMEIPGCLVALYLVSRLRREGMDPNGNMPGEPDYDPKRKPSYAHVDEHGVVAAINPDIQLEADLSLEDGSQSTEAYEQEVLKVAADTGAMGIFSRELLHEIFLNPGIYLLFGGITIGFISRLQGIHVVEKDDPFFVSMFQGALCLFLLEMGMTASRKLMDLKTAGWQFIAFGVLAPNLFATIGMCVAHAYSYSLGQAFEVGTYTLFAVLCGAASYIAVPAVQRLAIPEASPTLPLAASLGLTFSYNVTIGIPVYIMIAEVLTRQLPVVPLSPG